MDRTLPKELQPASSKWIAGRIQTLLSHYFQPDTPSDVTEAALGDWVKALTGFSADQIEAGCQSYLRNQPSRRPTPADVRNRIQGVYQQAEQSGRGSRKSLSADERYTLETKIIPNARRWLGIKGLADHGRQTLEFWGEQERGSQ